MSCHADDSAEKAEQTAAAGVLCRPKRLVERLESGHQNSRKQKDVQAQPGENEYHKGRSDHGMTVQCI